MRTPIECRTGSRSWIQHSSNRQDGVQAGDSHRARLLPPERAASGMSMPMVGACWSRPRQYEW
ncbi:hypothetical protein L5D93_03465 [Paenibacillus thiaminolyticus]|nr:hypothetical protein [Paenibacillus thiaminolyticus]